MLVIIWVLLNVLWFAANQCIQVATILELPPLPPGTVVAKRRRQIAEYLGAPSSYWVNSNILCSGRVGLLHCLLAGEDMVCSPCLGPLHFLLLGENLVCFPLIIIYIIWLICSKKTQTAGAWGFSSLCAGLCILQAVHALIHLFWDCG